MGLTPNLSQVSFLLVLWRFDEISYWFLIRLTQVVACQRRRTCLTVRTDGQRHFERGSLPLSRARHTDRAAMELDEMTRQGEA